MRLIIETLADKSERQYIFSEAIKTLDNNVISLDFLVQSETIWGKLNVWGSIDIPLHLKAQYENQSMLNDYPVIQSLIEKDLQFTSDKINRLL